MGRRRVSELELCFDSMTDLITNLAGGLVLVTLLLLGLTRDAPPVGQAAGRGVGGAAVRTLEEQMERLRAGGRQLDTDAAQADQEIQRLEEQVDAIDSPSPSAKPTK